MNNSPYIDDVGCDVSMLFQKMRPHDFVKETLDSTMFYGNRAIKDAGLVFDDTIQYYSLLHSILRVMQFIIVDQLRMESKFVWYSALL